MRFLPRKLCARLADPVTPTETWFEGACVCVDVVGFTELTERHAESGEQGLEHLGALLNASFARYIESVRQSGGEVVEFAGDALLAYWAADGLVAPAGLSSGLADESRRMARAVDAAVASALRMAEPSGAQVEAPSLHTGIGAGRIWAARIGNSETGTQLVLGGPAVRDAVTAQKLSERGEILAAPGASPWLAPELLAGHRHGHALIGSSARSLTSYKTIGTALEDAPITAWPMGMIPRVVQERWSGRPSGWFSELRRVTPVFTRVQGLGDTSPDALARLQAASNAIHEVASAFSLEHGRLLLDEEGLVFLLVFGIPYNTHVDDVARAMRVALAIERRLSALGFVCSAGVASGPAYCGVLGGEERSGYAIVGPPMNRAARLMARADRGLLCQAVDGELGAGDLDVSNVGPLNLKGLDGLRAVRVTWRTAPEETSQELAGRSDEQARIEALLRELASGTGAVLSVVGDAGLGKTTLVADLADRARRRGLRCIWARASPEQTASFGAFRQVLASLLALPDTLTRAELERRIAARLEHATRPEAAPLLASLLARSAEHEAEISGIQLRPDFALELLTDSVRDLVEASSVLVLEDVQWLDSASFRLAERLARAVPGLLMVLTSRSAHVPGLTQVLRASPRTHTIRLRALDERASVELATRLAGGRALPNELLGLIRSHSAGNPLYIVECLLLVGSLREGESARATQPRGRLSSLRGLITSRLDRLDASDAVAVRVASVLGDTVEWSLVERLMSLVEDGPPPASSAGLVRERILTPVDGAAASFRFSHALFREVAYELMLVQKRRELHAALAQLLEQNTPQAGAALLAHHWRLADDRERTRLWSDRAGTEALELGAYEEARQHFERCLALECESSARERVRWHRKLADAYAGLGSLRRRAEHARAGLALAGERPRAARGTKLPGALRELALFWLRPRRLRGDGSGVEIAALYRHLAHSAYFESDGLSLFVHTLRAVHAAELDAPSPVLSGAMSELGGALGLAGLHRTGLRYLDAALKAAAGLDDPHGTAHVHMVRSLYLVGRGEWAASEESAGRCQAICESTGDSANWGNAQIVRFWLAYYRGLAPLAESLATALLGRARRTGNRQHESWALRGLALLRLRAGAASSAFPMLESALGSANERDANEFMPTQAALALCCLKLGERERALDLAEKALALARNLGRPTGHAILSGLLAIAEVTFATSPRSAARRGLAPVLERLDAYRRVFPIGDAAYHAWRARADESAGRVRAAQKHRARAVLVAKRLDMPGESQGSL